MATGVYVQDIERADWLLVALTGLQKCVGVCVDKLRACNSAPSARLLCQSKKPHRTRTSTSWLAICRLPRKRSTHSSAKRVSQNRERPHTGSPRQRIPVVVPTCKNFCTASSVVGVCTTGDCHHAFAEFIHSLVHECIVALGCTVFMVGKGPSLTVAAF